MTKEEAIIILKNHHMWTGEPQEVNDVRAENKALCMAIEALKEQKTGKWLYDKYYLVHECSECKEQALEEFTVNPRTLDRDYDEVLSEYCPHCGSRMLEVENEEDEW